MRANRGFDDWFTELFDAHYADLFRYAIRRCASGSDADDVVSEAFMAAWRRRDEIPEGENARLWLFGAARQVLRNYHRGQRRHDRLIARIRQLWSGPWQDDVADLHNEGALAATLSRLNQPDREVILLSAWEGLSAPEIATVVGTSPAAVRKRLQRARERFQSLHVETTDSGRGAAVEEVGR